MIRGLGYFNLHVLIILITGNHFMFVSSNGKNVGASDDCKQLLESFAFATANFTYCAISNARPITLCKSCIQSYLRVKQIYSDILVLEDTGGEMCKDQLFNLDRLQVVDSGFQYIDQLWGRASCTTCFVKDDILTPEVQAIIDSYEQLVQCIKEHRNDTVPYLYDPKVCTVCLNKYQALNYKYNNLKATTGDINFCMDIVDLINSTRSSWSGEIGCCQDRKKPEMIFLITSSVIALTPVLFYLAAFAFSSKKEDKVAPLKRWTLKREGAPLR